MGRSDHFQTGATEHQGGAAYDEHLPHPGDKPGRVEFAGRQLPATSFYHGDYSNGFTTPLENGAMASVSYFPHQKLTNISLLHLQEGRDGHVTGRPVGAVGPHGEEPTDVVAAVHKMHGDRPPNMPRSPEEAVSDLEYYSKLKMPAHVRDANRKLLSPLREQWSWKP